MVEMMVGVVVGLFVVGGAVYLFVGNLANSRKLLVEARLNQEVRNAADVIARELRRAGYWDYAIAGTVTNSLGASAQVNPNRGITVTSDGDGISYEVSRDVATARGGCGVAICENIASENDEKFGFRLQSGVLQMNVPALDGAKWRDLTDPSAVTVNSFAITKSETPIDARIVCPTPCAGSACPTVTVRRYTVQIKATSTTDSAITRSIQEQVRVRNDELAGTCT